VNALSWGRSTTERVHAPPAPAWLAVGAALVVAYALKRHHSVADVEDLRWILRPTTMLTGGLLGEPFQWESGVGYVSTRLAVAVTTACAGVNFLIVAWLTLVLGAARAMTSPRRALLAFVTSALAAYALTVVVNALRICVAATVHREHRTEGVVLYLGAACLAYAASQWLSRRWACASRA